MRGGIAGIAAALRKTCEGQKHVTFTSACPRGYGGDMRGEQKTASYA